MKNSHGILITLVILILVGLACQSNNDAPSTGKDDSSSKQPLNKTESGTVADSIFAKPLMICDALANDGLPTLPKTRWKNLDGVYACVSDSLQVTTGGYTYKGDLPNTIVYYAESDVKDRVEMIRLTANIFNEKKGTPVKAKFKRIVTALFKNLSLTIPIGLIKNIEKSATSKYEQKYGKVTLAREKYKFGYGLALEIRGSSFLKNKNAPEPSVEPNIEFALELSEEIKRENTQIILGLPEYEKINEVVSKFGFKINQFETAENARKFPLKGELTGLLFSGKSKQEIDGLEFRVFLMGPTMDHVENVRLQSYGEYSLAARTKLLGWATRLLKELERGEIPQKFSKGVLSGKSVSGDEHFSNGSCELSVLQKPWNNDGDPKRISLDISFRMESE